MDMLQAVETKILTVEDEIQTVEELEFGEGEEPVVPEKEDVSYYLTASEKRKWRHLSPKKRQKMLSQALRREQKKSASRQVASEDWRVSQGRQQAAGRRIKEAQSGKRPGRQGNAAGRLPDGTVSVKGAGYAADFGKEGAKTAVNVAAAPAATAATGGVNLAVKAAKKAAEKFRKELEETIDREEKKIEGAKSSLKNEGGEEYKSLSSIIKGPGGKLVSVVATAVSMLAAKAASTLMTLLLSLLGAFIPMLLIFFLIFTALFSAISSFVTGGQAGTAHVSPEVESYRPYLEKYAKLYPGMEDLVDLMLAMIMQEAGGEPWIGTMNGDIMQSSESAGYPGPGYLTGEASIAQGVKYLATEVFNKAGLLDDPYNLDKTKLGLQGYNYGSGYITWALSNYGGYSETNAVIFSDMMAARLGWNGYGDKLYVQHVMRYYEISYSGFGSMVSTTEITNAETKKTLEELASRWSSGLDEGRMQIITKGCTLVGYTTYDMYGADTRAGVDMPRTLDCSSFVAWCFHKCGYTDVPYESTTGTFLGASNFQRIDASQLKPGDIGLINWVASGGSNHVGIYVGTDAAGTPMWLHCTSHTNPGSSVVTGPRISYYSAFSLFFRYRGFHD